MQIILASAKIMNDRLKSIPDISLSIPRFQNEAEAFAKDMAASSFFTIYILVSINTWYIYLTLSLQLLHNDICSSLCYFLYQLFQFFLLHCCTFLFFVAKEHYFDEIGGLAKKVVY